MSLISLLLSALLLAAPHATSSKRTQAISQSELTALSTTFTVNNQIPAAIGMVTLHFAGQSDAFLNVPGQGVFGIDIEETPTLCMVCGQNLPQNTPTSIWISEHSGVRMTWTSSVIVVDQALTR